MIKRKFTSILIGSLIGLILFGLLFLQPNMNLAERISYVFQLLPFAFPFILLYGGTVTLLSDYIANHFEGLKRLITSFLIHFGFGILFGIILPSKLHVSILGLDIDMFSLIATVVAIAIWGMDEVLKLRKIIKRFALFMTGLILFIITIPFTVFMTLEELKEKELANRYTISRATGNSVYQFNQNEIEVLEELNDNQNATMDRWKNRVMIGDITIRLNDSKLILLENSPIRIEWDGLDRYYGQLSMFRLTNHEDGSSKVIIMVKSAAEEDLIYTYYEINESGDVKEKTFHYQDRSQYETFLLNNSTLPRGTADYYGEGYHTPAFPVSTILSIVLIGLNWPRRKKGFPA